MKMPNSDAALLVQSVQSDIDSSFIKKEIPIKRKLNTICGQTSDIVSIKEEIVSVNDDEDKEFSADESVKEEKGIKLNVAKEKEFDSANKAHTIMCTVASVKEEIILLDEDAEELSGSEHVKEELDFEWNVDIESIERELNSKIKKENMEQGQEKETSTNVDDEKESSQNAIGEISKRTCDPERDEETRNYMCEICHKLFKRRSYLSQHKRIHTGKKRFTCNVCNRSFLDKSHLLRHELIHTGEKPFKCHICSKSFSHKSTLLRHLHIHSDEKPYTCNVCNKSYSENSELLRHTRIHTGEKVLTCDLCNKLFLKESLLLQHIRTHTGEKPFICHICSKSFTQKSNLLAHLHIHTGEKPFTCDVCFVPFSLKAYLLKHKRIHDR